MIIYDLYSQFHEGLHGTFLFCHDTTFLGHQIFMPFEKLQVLFKSTCQECNQQPNLHNPPLTIVTNCSNIISFSTKGV